MLRVEMHKSLRQPTVVEATRVVVYDREGNPISIAVEEGRQFFVSKIGDPDFDNALKALGINQTVIVTDFQEKPLNEIRFPSG